jgi:hypothetical protein
MTATEDPFRALAERLLRTGKVTEETTFDQLPAILAAEAIGDVDEACR